jgi:FK506-binding protein 1
MDLTSHHITSRCFLFVLQDTRRDSDGKDQLQRDVGTVVKGDQVTIHYTGRYLKNNKKKEFEDTYHSEKKLKFTVGNGEVIQGLDEGIQTMILGEEARLTITSDYAYGKEGHKGYVSTVPPDADIVLDVALFAVARNGVLHNRKQPKDDSCWLTKVLYCLCRAY